MRKKKLLYGVNSKCAQCTEQCKQFKQVKVIYCPHFKPVVSNSKKEVPFKHKESSQMLPDALN